MNREIKKAIIPAAGLGTRMLPAAKAIPKEMLPVVDRPAIQRVVEECATAGATDVLLITSREKRAIEDHFDRNLELERRLEASKRLGLLDSVTELMKKVALHAIRQPEQRGLGDAVRWAESYVGNDPFLCLLGDAVFLGEPSPCQELIQIHNELGGSVIGLEVVPEEKVSRYGIVIGNEIRPGVVRITDLKEKPKASETPSRLAIAARYLLEPQVFEHLRTTKPGKGGEIQLTDAIVEMAKNGVVHGVLLKSRRYDIGNPADWLMTNLAFARENEAFWRELNPKLQGVMREK